MSIDGTSPSAKFLRLPPESDFACSVFWVGRPMNGVTTNVNAEVTTDGSWSRQLWLGNSHHSSGNGDNVVSLPYHGANWAGCEEVDEAWEEWALLVLSIVILSESLGRSEELQ